MSRWRNKMNYTTGRAAKDSWWGRETGGALFSARRTARAFVLAEVLLALVIICFLALATLSAINVSRIQRVKDHDQGIMQDFAMHYLELVKALAFEKIKPRTPLNDLFDGTNGAPLIIIPNHTNWFILNTADYEVFHPELVWLTNRGPQMQVILTNYQVSGVDHTKHIQLGLRWLPPLNNGSTQSIRLDLIRVKDL